MTSNRRNYASPAEWLRTVRQDDAWLGMKEQLETSTDADIAVHREDAARRIGSGMVNEYWKIHRNKANRVELVVTEVWELESLTLPKLKLQAIGMLTMEWIEQNCKTAKMHGTRKENMPSKQLQTEEAEPLWAKLREGGFIVAGGYALAEGVSNNQAAYIADCIAVKLSIRNKWKVFEHLWGLRNMAQLAGTWRETGKPPARADEIRRLLK